MMMLDCGLWGRWNLHGNTASVFRIRFWFHVGYQAFTFEKQHVSTPRWLKIYQGGHQLYLDICTSTMAGEGSVGLWTPLQRSC